MTHVNIIQFILNNEVLKNLLNTINITQERQNLFKLVSNVNVGFSPITIVNNINEIRKIGLLKSIRLISNSNFFEHQ